MSSTSAAALVTPAVPERIAPRQLAIYALASLTFGLAQGMGNYLVSSNLQAVQATFGATTNEAVWLMVGYSSTSITASLLLWKLRTQFGLRLVAKITLVFLVLLALAHVVATDLGVAVLLRAMAGFAGAILNILAFLYILEALPPRHKLMAGIALGLTGSQIAVPLSRLISPRLLLEPTLQARALARKQVEVVNYPDGRFAVRHAGCDLAVRMLDKIVAVTPDAIVESKRLGEALTWIKARQEAYPAHQQRGAAERARPPNNLEAPGSPSHNGRSGAPGDISTLPPGRHFKFTPTIPVQPMMKFSTTRRIQFRMNGQPPSVSGRKASPAGVVCSNL